MNQHKRSKRLYARIAKQPMLTPLDADGYFKLYPDLLERGQRVRVVTVPLQPDQPAYVKAAALKCPPFWL